MKTDIDTDRYVADAWYEPSPGVGTPAMVHHSLTATTEHEALDSALREIRKVGRYRQLWAHELPTVHGAFALTDNVNMIIGYVNVFVDTGDTDS